MRLTPHSCFPFRDECIWLYRRPLLISFQSLRMILIGEIFICCGKNDKKALYFSGIVAVRSNTRGSIISKKCLLLAMRWAIVFINQLERDHLPKFGARTKSSVRVTTKCLRTYIINWYNDPRTHSCFTSKQSSNMPLIVIVMVIHKTILFASPTAC